MGASEDVEFCGVYEPSEEVKEWLGQDPVYEGVHWFESKEEFLEDETIQCIACQGLVSENLAFAREALEHGNHVWLDKPAGDDLDEFRSVLDIAEERDCSCSLDTCFATTLQFSSFRIGRRPGSLARYIPCGQGCHPGRTRMIRTGGAETLAASARGHHADTLFRAITLKQTAESCHDPPAA